MPEEMHSEFKLNDRLHDADIQCVGFSKPNGSRRTQGTAVDGQANGNSYMCRMFTSYRYSVKRLKELYQAILKKWFVLHQFPRPIFKILAMYAVDEETVPCCRFR
jgi:hypothetical protein